MNIPPRGEGSLRKLCHLMNEHVFKKIISRHFLWNLSIFVPPIHFHPDVCSHPEHHLDVNLRQLLLVVPEGAGEVQPGSVAPLYDGGAGQEDAGQTPHTCRHCR